jgi:class 3 adenylate cyclase
LVQRLDFWAEQGTLLEHGAGEAAAALTESCVDLEHRLLTLAPSGSLPHLPDGDAQRQLLLAERLMELLLAIRSFAAAFAWSFLGVPDFGSEPRVTRRRTVLFADLSGSTPQGLRLDRQANVKWKNGGLNLIAQWGQAFGGVEMRDREGDDVVLEFSEADGALLCAALIQEHARVLRSTGVPALSWGFRLALDSDEITDADGGNVIGSCIDRAAKLAKTFRDEQSIERVVLTPETAHLVSEFGRRFFSQMETEVDIARGEDVGSAADLARFYPCELQRDRLLENYADRLSGA